MGPQFSEQLGGVPQSHVPAEFLGGRRDGVKLLSVDRKNGTISSDIFSNIANYLKSGDLLVVNNSSLVNASLSSFFKSTGEYGYLNFGTSRNGKLVLVEPRPKELNEKLTEMDEVTIIGPQIDARLVRRHETYSRYWWADIGNSSDDLPKVMEEYGRPIAYEHLYFPVPREYYMTPFSRVPGSVEPPSAGFPFTEAVLEEITAMGVGLAEITLHCNIGSLEPHEFGSRNTLLDENYSIPLSTLERIKETKRVGGRVIAVGTTVVRALESYSSGIGTSRMKENSIEGKTDIFIRRGFRFQLIDALITGMHDGGSSHIDLISAMVGPEMLETAYGLAVEWGYMWHEFGDVTLIS